jgi:hypothetical protein
MTDINAPFRKARDLNAGDVFRLHVYGEVLEVSPVANGKRIKVKVGLEDQGRRANCGVPTGSQRKRKPSGLEFLDTSHVLEFICTPSRVFHLHEWWDDGDDEGEDVSPPSPALTDEHP